MSQIRGSGQRKSPSEAAGVFPTPRALTHTGTAVPASGVLGSRRHRGMQAEAGCLSYPVIEWLSVLRQGDLQGEHLAPCLRPHGNAVGDGMAHINMRLPARAEQT
jgi:hypothetical protein